MSREAVRTTTKSKMELHQRNTTDGRYTLSQEAPAQTPRES